MAQLITITRVAEAIQGFQLQANTDMFTALAYLTTNLGYVGNVNSFIDGTGKPQWQLTIQSTTRQGTQGIAIIGDWVILENNAVASICPASQFASLYAAPGS